MPMAIPKLSKVILIGTGIALVLGIVLIGYKSCNLSDKYSLLTGEFNAYKQVADNNTKVAQKTIDNQTKVIGDMTKKIAVHEIEASKKNEQIKDVNKKLTVLEGEYATLTDCPSQRENLTKQVAEWKDKFSLSEGIIKDKDGIIFSLTGKHDAQIKITEAVRVQLTDCIKLQTLYDDRISVLEKALKQARFMSKLKSWGGVALAAGVTYFLLKGK